MLKWFKREPAPVARPAARPAASPRPRAASRGREPEAPAPLPEVVAEGNTQADWSAWEDSMTALDSQFPGLDHGARVQVRDSRFGSAATEPEDPFARVGQRRDL